MPDRENLTDREPSRYATQADFCRVFEANMNRLYLLSFLLTGNHSMEEKCFVRGLEDAVRGNHVFTQWAESWARRTIIQNAIQMVRPRPADRSITGSTSDGSEDNPCLQRREITAIVELPTFDRFAFVLSVLERYSDQECSLLLSCTRSDVMAARIRAMQEIGQSERSISSPHTHCAEFQNSDKGDWGNTGNM